MLRYRNMPHAWLFSKRNTAVLTPAAGSRYPQIRYIQRSLPQAISGPARVPRPAGGWGNAQDLGPTGAMPQAPTGTQVRAASRSLCRVARRAIARIQIEQREDFVPRQSATGRRD